MPPRMNSNLEGTKAFIPIDRDWYNGRCTGCTSKTSSNKNPMLELNWQVVDHPKYNNRTINFDTVMIGGKDKTGAQMSLNRLLNYIDALRIPYICGNCKVEQIGVVKQREEYLCPGCKAPLTGIDYATEDFVGKLAKIYVDVDPVKRKDENGELQDTGEFRNKVTQVKSL